jgi:hypothetical protein
MFRSTTLHFLVAGVLCVAFAWSWAGEPAGNKNGPKGSPALASLKRHNRAIATQEALTMLDMLIETKGVQTDTTLRELIDTLRERFATQGKELPLIINAGAFAPEETGGDPSSLGNTRIKLPPLPRQMQLASALRLALAQSASPQMTFLIRNGIIEIVSEGAAKTASLLQTRVVGNFSRTPFDEIIEDLSNQTGATIAIDNRAADKAKTPISITLRNEVSLEAALRILSETAELKLVIMPAGLFITTPSHAEILLKEMKKQPM